MIRVRVVSMVLRGRVVEPGVVVKLQEVQWRLSLARNKAH